MKNFVLSILLVLVTLCGLSCKDSEPGETEARLYIQALSDYEAGKLDAARTIFQDLSTRFPSMRMAHLMEAKSALFLGKLDEANSILENLVKDDPSWAEARFWRIRCLRAKGDLEAAGNEAASLLTLAPNDIRLLSEAAYIAHQSGRIDVALSLLEQARLVREDLAMVEFSIARIYHELGRNDLATTALSTSLLISRSQGPLHQAAKELQQQWSKEIQP